MKTIIAFFLLTLFSGLIYAQEIQQNNVPAVVLNAFQLKFRNADDVKWKLGKGFYRVIFEINNKDNELLMNDKGTILKHQQDLYVSEIPKTVLETIQSKVAFFDVNDAKRYEEGGKITYKINFEIKDKDHDFLIDGNGKLLKYTKELMENEVPAPFLASIKSKYGLLDIDDSEFKEENGKISYQFKGEINDMDHFFVFDDQTNLLRHHQELRNSEIPANVMATISANYSGHEIIDADLIEEGGKSTYDIKLRKSKGKVYIILSTEGKIIKVKRG